MLSLFWRFRMTFFIGFASFIHWVSPIFICGSRKQIYTLLFLIFLVLYSARIIPTLKFLKYSISNYVKDMKEKDIELHLDDGGLTEATNGIVSKAPWVSVVS